MYAVQRHMAVAMCAPNDVSYLRSHNLQTEVLGVCVRAFELMCFRVSREHDDNAGSLAHIYCSYMRAQLHHG